MSRSYNVYQFCSSALIKDARRTSGFTWLEQKYKRKSKKRDRNERADMWIMARMMSADPGQFLRESMDGTVLCEEHDWKYFTDRSVLFPESIELLEHLQAAKFDAAGLALTVPFESFMFCPPSGFRLAGFECPGVLVTWMSYRERTDQFNRFFKELDCDPIPLVTDPTKQITDPDEKFISIQYKSLVGTFDHGHPVFSTSRAMVPVSFMPGVLAAANCDEYKDIVGQIAPHQQLAFQLNGDENAFQFELIKLIAGMCVYIQALGSEVLRDGYPDEKRPKFKALAAGGKEYHLKAVAKPKDQSREHHRSWHFRTLTNDRFYTAPEWQDKPRGSRVVFVRDSWVGMGVDAHTIEDQLS